MSEQLAPVAARFARAVGHTEAVTKSKTADLGNYSYTYVTLNDVLDSIRSAVAQEGLAVSQHVEAHPPDRQQIVTALTCVETGEQMLFPGPVFPVTGDPQALGSAITYHRRYSLVTLFAMNVLDDDGAQANRAATRPQERTEAEKAIRAGLAELDDDLRKAFAEDFKAQFNSTLTRLPESKHGEALAFWKWWLTGGTDETDTNEGDTDD